MTETRKHWIVLIIMLYIVYVAMMWKWGMQGDMMYWLEWSKQIYNHGFAKVYDFPDCNYLPAYLYFLLLHVKVQGNLTDIQDNLYTIKYYTFIFDILGAIAAVWFVKDEFKKIFYFLVLLFNVAYIYNTVMWAQVDAIYTFFGFAAVIAAIERKIIFSVLFLWIALNFKLQALVFIPVVGLVLLPQLITKNGIKKVIMAIIIGGILQVIILLPFILAGRLHQVLFVITDSVGHYPYPSMCAFNLWYLLFPNVTIEDMYSISDATKFGFLSYKQIGFLLFFINTVLACLPLFIYLYKKHIKQVEIKFPLQHVFLILSLVVLGFFYFNTEMHERYMHPAMITIAAFTFLSRKFIPLILCSVAYFLNLERICWYLNLHNDTYMKGFIFNPKVAATIYLILIGILYYYLYFDKEEKEMIEI